MIGLTGEFLLVRFLGDTIGFRLGVAASVSASSLNWRELRLLGIANGGGGPVPKLLETLLCSEPWLE